MKEYHKIETLFKFNQEYKKFEYGNFYNRSVELLKGVDWIFTEKIDGTNFRIYWNGHTLSYGGRTNKANFSKQQIEYIDTIVNDTLETMIEQMFGEKEVYLFGELFGKNIQKHGSKYDSEYKLMFFDVMVDDLFLARTSAYEVVETLGLVNVPYVFTGTIENALEYVEQTQKSTFSNAPIEGLVGKPCGDFRDRTGKRIVVKIKKRDIEKSIRL